MMDWIREYVLSIIAAGIISGICISLVPKNSSTGMVIKMLGGIFLAVTLIAPLIKVRFDDLAGLWDQVSVEADSLVEEGSNSTQEALSLVIKENLESYILDKANKLGLQLQVSVIMDQEDQTMPQQIEIQGAVSPYQQKILSDYIADQLAIAEEQQIWN